MHDQVDFRVSMNFWSHHKCATRWLADYLSRTALLNGWSFFHTDFGDEPGPDAADLAFFGNANYAFVVAGGAPGGLAGWHVIRNPMAVIVSSYYSHLRTHPLDGWPELSPQRAVLNAVCKQDGMFLTLAFLERADIAQRAIGPLLSLRRWNYDDARCQTLRMEDMVADPDRVFAKAFAVNTNDTPILLPDAADMTFARFSGGRNIGQIDDTSHYRSGAPESWREELPSAVILYMRSRFADVLERFYPEALLD